MSDGNQHGAASAAVGLTASFIALCASARSFLGRPGKTLKCVISEDPGALRTSKLVGDVRAFVLEMAADPTSADILLEALDGQVRWRICKGWGAWQLPGVQGMQHSQVAAMLPSMCAPAGTGSKTGIRHVLGWYIRCIAMHVYSR